MVVVKPTTCQIILSTSAQKKNNSEAEKYALTVLSCCKSVSRKEVSSLVSQYLSLSEKSPQFFRFWRTKMNAMVSKEEVEVLTKKLQASSKTTQTVAFFEGIYPKYLLELDVIPPVLFMASNLSLEECAHLLSRPSLAVVGTRRITGYGTLVVKKILSEFEGFLQNKIPIISGFMYGVDQLAHQVAIELSVPTIAVLAHGIDAVVPRDISLYEKILMSGGVLISEYAPWESAAKWTFIERNRIVAALSSVILVPEAASKSGSMHTVEFGLDLGKTICAVPGPITSPYSDGTRSLLNSGAILVGSGQELVSIFFPELQAESIEFGSAGVQNSGEESGNELLVVGKKTLKDEILSLLKTQNLSAEKIAEETKLSLKKVLYELSYLELQSKVVKKGPIWMLQYHLPSG